MNTPLEERTCAGSRRRPLRAGIGESIRMDGKHQRLRRENP